MVSGLLTRVSADWEGHFRRARLVSFKTHSIMVYETV